MHQRVRKIVVGITGASGSIYAKVLLDKLSALQKASDLDLTVGVVWSRNARTVWKTELGSEVSSRYAFAEYGAMDFMAPFASGSARYDTMLIVPCSMGTLGRIATGMSNDLMTRAADVVLKERRRLILVPRDTPLSLIHLRNMTAVTEAGAIVAPAMPSFYSGPQDFETLAATVVDRVLDLADLSVDTYRWGEQA
jgi:4-hydroxy-3-polyprenylbenzoate decarboxylase